MSCSLLTQCGLCMCFVQLTQHKAIFLSLHNIIPLVLRWRNSMIVGRCELRFRVIFRGNLHLKSSGPISLQYSPRWTCGLQSISGIFPPIFHTPIHIQISLIRRTSGQRLETFKAMHYSRNF